MSYGKRICQAGWDTQTLSAKHSALFLRLFFLPKKIYFQQERDHLWTLRVGLDLYPREQFCSPKTERLWKQNTHAYTSARPHINTHTDKKSFVRLGRLQTRSIYLWWGRRLNPELWRTFCSRRSREPGNTENCLWVGWRCRKIGKRGVVELQNAVKRNSKQGHSQGDRHPHTENHRGT